MDTTTIHTNPTRTPTGRTRDQLVPTVLVVVFTTLITGWFNLSEAMPLPLAVLAGAAWGVLVGWAASRLRRHPTMGAWLGSLRLPRHRWFRVRRLRRTDGHPAAQRSAGQLLSDGRALQSTFLPAIPYYVIVNSILGYSSSPRSSHSVGAPTTPHPHPGRRRGCTRDAGMDSTSPSSRPAWAGPTKTTQPRY